MTLSRGKVERRVTSCKQSLEYSCCGSHLLLPEQERRKPAGRGSHELQPEGDREGESDCGVEGRNEAVDVGEPSLECEGEGEKGNEGC